jgi:serine/threonine protein kinase
MISLLFLNFIQTHQRSLRQRLQEQAATNPRITPLAIDLCDALLVLNPEKRLSAAAALEHPYWTSESPNFVEARQTYAVLST